MYTRCTVINIFDYYYKLFLKNDDGVRGLTLAVRDETLLRRWGISKSTLHNQLYLSVKCEN